jgi:hypothetical protein
VAILTAGLLWFCAAPLHAAGNASTQSIMHDVYDAIAYLLPLSLRDTNDRSVWDNVLIDEKLHILKSASTALETHFRGRDPELGGIARSFDDMSANVVKAFSNEWPEFAYFSMMDLVQHCVACHSRLEAPSQVLFGQRLLARVDVNELPPSDVIKLYIATRQFDSALRSLETSLMNRDWHPIEADYTSAMVDYLQIAINAQRSPATAEKFLRKYLGRGDVPYYLERRFTVWLAALADYADALNEEPSIATAKTIFRAADSLSRGPGNRLRAAHDIIAASIIRNYLAGHPDVDPATAGEAYYMLGVVALRTLEPKSAVPEMEMLLAASIQADPAGPHAAEAYALIEEYGYVHEAHLAGDYGGQTLIDMAKLRGLIERD